MYISIFRGWQRQRFRILFQLPTDQYLLSSGTNSFVVGDNVADIPPGFHFFEFELTPDVAFPGVIQLTELKFTFTLVWFDFGTKSFVKEGGSVTNMCCLLLFTLRWESPPGS